MQSCHRQGRLACRKGRFQCFLARMPNRDKTQSIESRPAPRRSESSVSQTQPAIKVVGFRVEGAAPSPSPPSTLLADSQRAAANVTSATPNPLLITPSFQVKYCHNPEAESAHHEFEFFKLLHACRLTPQLGKQQLGGVVMHLLCSTLQLPDKEQRPCLCLAV